MCEGCSCGVQTIGYSKDQKTDVAVSELIENPQGHAMCKVREENLEKEKN